MLLTAASDSPCAHFLYTHLSLSCISCMKTTGDESGRGRIRPGTTPCKKTNLYFTFECRNCVNLFSTPIGLNTCLGVTCTERVQFGKEIRNSNCGLRSPKYAELCNFTLLFCRGRQRNVRRFITHVHSYCIVCGLLKPC